MPNRAVRVHLEFGVAPLGCSHPRPGYVSTRAEISQLAWVDGPVPKSSKRWLVASGDTADDYTARAHRSRDLPDEAETGADDLRVVDLELDGDKELTVVRASAELKRCHADSKPFAERSANAATWKSGSLLAPWHGNQGGSPASCNAVASSGHTEGHSQRPSNQPG